MSSWSLVRSSNDCGKIESMSFYIDFVDKIARIDLIPPDIIIIFKLDYAVNRSVSSYQAYFYKFYYLLISCPFVNTYLGIDIKIDSSYVVLPYRHTNPP